MSPYQLKQLVTDKPGLEPKISDVRSLILQRLHPHKSLQTARRPYDPAPSEVASGVWFHFHSYCKIPKAKHVIKRSLFSSPFWRSKGMSRYQLDSGENLVVLGIAWEECV